ncbi:ABC-2 transporter permease [Gorillibacterium sp. sgz5001074]|uniref:ABC-2 transporter permease n=1 Tax=Gorillibacterium sp. sgz5001074 TaxID=3446695 RepID=UPI003F663E17
MNVNVSPNASSVWMSLLKHERKCGGSWRKANRGRLSRSWRLAYCFLVFAVFLGAASYFAYTDDLRLQGLWFAGTGFPYMIFFLGHGMMKREWENDTYGWWLTLPYSRQTLVSAKWAAGWLRAARISLIVFAAGSLYAGAVVLVLPHYVLADWLDFVLTGINWLILLLGYAPLLLSLGQLTNVVFWTAWKPLGPVLLAGSMVCMGLLYSTLSGSWTPAFDQLSGDVPATFFPFPWEVAAGIPVSLLFAWLILRLTSYLLERKITL